MWYSTTKKINDPTQIKKEDKQISHSMIKKNIGMCIGFIIG